MSSEKCIVAPPSIPITHQFHALLCPPGHGCFMKHFCKIILSFLFCCGSLKLKTRSARGRYIVNKIMAKVKG